MRKNFISKFVRQSWRVTLSLFWLGLWLFGLGLLLWYPLRWWPGDRLEPVRLVNYIMPWLLGGLLPGVFVAVLARRWRLSLVLAMPTILIGLTFAPLFLPRPNLALAADSAYTVMSYNIWRRNSEIKAIVKVIGDVQPDILLLQEVNPWLVKNLNNALADYYPERELYLAYESSLGQAVISPYPLTPLGAVREGRIQKVLLDTPHGPVTVWNVHASQPLPWSRQYRQIRTLTEDLAAVDTPLIVGGDFNTTDQSETYQLLARQLGNAHWDAGWGFGFTFPAHTPRVKRVPLLTPVVRIDHIFYSQQFFAYNARTLTDSGGSDHFPVVTELLPVK